MPDDVGANVPDEEASLEININEVKALQKLLLSAADDYNKYD